MHYRFVDLSLDIDGRVLQRAGQTVKLRPKVFDLLVYLVEHRDRVISKHELMQQLWPGRYVGETTLSSCLRELRQAVGDSGRQQTIIKTFHGRGYRFVATLAVAQNQGLAAPVPTPPPTTTEPPTTVGEPDTEPATAVAAAPVGEHKIVSVLSGGLCDAAAIASQLGAEDMDRFMQTWLAATQRIIARFDGQITQWLSDGFVALFGAPQAYEDHARRAVLAALELVRQHPRPDDHSPAPMAVAVHSGPVVISYLNDDPQRLYTAPGETTQTVDALRQRELADTVLISASTYRLVAADVEVVALSTAADNAEAYQLVRMIASHAGVPRPTRRKLTRFVGRRQELALLNARLRYAREGQGQVVTLVGDPGIGKSRLLHEFSTRLKGVGYYQLACFSHGRSTPYLPLLALLRQLGEIPENATAERIIAPLQGLLASAQIRDQDALSLLLQLFDLPDQTNELSQLSPQAQRQQTLRVLRTLALATTQPRVIAVENCHWIDATSEEWLTAVVAQLARAPVLVLLTYRPTYRPPWLQHRPATELLLPHLTQADSLKLLRSLPHVSRTTAQLRMMAEKGNGNPFFLEELAFSADDKPDTIPDTVQGVLAARIDALQTNDKQLLQAAAAIGTRIPVTLLQGISDSDEVVFESSITRLQHSELLVEDHPSGLVRELTFKHVLVHDVAYQSLLGEQRRTLHTRIATLLQAQFQGTTWCQPETLAYHYTAAQDYPQAVAYWQQAARRAYQRSAYRETTDYVHQGLNTLSHVADTVEHRRLELRLQTTLGPALMAARGYGAPEVESTLTRALTLCEQLDDSAALFRVLIGLSNYYWVRGRFAHAYATNRRLIKLARRTGNPANRLRAHAAMGELLVHGGRLRSAKRHLENGIRAYLSQAKETVATPTPVVACLCYSAWSWWQSGYDERALAQAERALNLAHELSHPFSQAIALSLMAELQQFRLDIPSTLHLARAGSALAHEQDFPFWEGTALVLLGWAEAQSGQCNQGLATIKRGLDLFRSTHAEVQLSSWYGLLAESYAQDGQLEAALEAITEALQWAEKTDERYYEAELYRLRGGLLIQQGAETAGQTNLQHAMRLAEQRGARIWQLRAACDLAELWRHSGEGKKGRGLLTPLYDAFDEGFDAPDLQRVRILLENTLNRDVC